MKALLRRINKDGERYLLLPLYVFIVMVVSLEVLRRFLLNYSSIWGEEAARHAFIYICWIGAAAGVHDRIHIRINFIMRFLSERGCGILFIFGDIVTLILAIVALYYSIGPVLTSLKFGSLAPGLRISYVWFLISVPLGFSMVALRLVQSIKRDWSDLRAGRPVFTGCKLFD